MNLNQAENAANNAAGRVQKAAESIADDAQTQTEKFARQTSVAARDAYGKARTEVREAAAVVRGKVHRQPLVALAIASAIGGFVGVMLARR